MLKIVARTLFAGLAICLLSAFVTGRHWVPRVVSPWHDESIELEPGTRIGVYYGDDALVGTLVIEALNNREFMAASISSLSYSDEADFLLHLEVDWREPLSIAWYHPSRKLLSIHLFLYEPESMVLVGATSIATDIHVQGGYPIRPADESEPVSAVNKFVFRDLAEICAHSLLNPSDWRSGY